MNRETGIRQDDADSVYVWRLERGLPRKQFTGELTWRETGLAGKMEEGELRE